MAATLICTLPLGAYAATVQYIEEDINTPTQDVYQREQRDVHKIYKGNITARSALFFNVSVTAEGDVDVKPDTTIVDDVGAGLTGWRTGTQS